MRRDSHNTKEWNIFPNRPVHGIIRGPDPRWAYHGYEIHLLEDLRREMIECDEDVSGSMMGRE